MANRIDWTPEHDDTDRGTLGPNPGLDLRHHLEDELQLTAEREIRRSLWWSRSAIVALPITIAMFWFTYRYGRGVARAVECAILAASGGVQVYCLFVHRRVRKRWREVL